MAKSFGELMESLWKSDSCITPKDFKEVLGSINEQFQGDEQQDSQEFISFLIDSLHEDLNLRKNKPYSENPDSENRNLIDLGLEVYSQNLRRDWSFISFIFNG